MRRDYNEKHAFGDSQRKATFVIDKTGFRVENKHPNYEQDDRFINGFLTDCLNMDEWQHSWYINVSDAKSRKSPERNKVREVLMQKIASRQEEIKTLKDALAILGRWHY